MEPTRDHGGDPHWGAIDEGLLYDQARFDVYARSHHIAGHHWSLWRQGEFLGPAGGSLRLPGCPDADVAADVEATSVLIEAVGVEFLRELHRLADFGFGLEDLDWDSLRSHLGDCWGMARGRGCRFTLQAAHHLGDESWLHQTAWYVLREWDEIAALADLLGRGQVLEADEVAAVLRWW